MKAFFFILFGLIFSLQNLAQTRFSKWNFSYQYDLSSFVFAEYRLLDAGDSLLLYMKLTFDKTNRDFMSEMRRENLFSEYKITSSYENKAAVMSGSVKWSGISESDKEYIFSVVIPKPEDINAFLFIAFYQSDKGKLLIQDIPLKIFEKELYSPTLLFEKNGKIPVFSNYITKGDSLLFKRILKNNNKPLKIDYYKYNFPTALPPMSVETSNDFNIKLTPDTSIFINESTPVSFEKKGNYAIRSPKSDTKGFNFMVVENKFPKASRTKELIDPTIYLSSDDERRSIRAAQKQKVKLDDFWLSMGQDADFARKLIKNYYNKVEQVNRLFTCHKEGWKTDMGLLYIILGAPNEVYRNDEKEMWKYKKRAQIPALTFIFIRRVNPFGDYYYELQNSVDYGNVWYNVIELWRRGIIEK